MGSGHREEIQERERTLPPQGIAGAIEAVMVRRGRALTFPQACTSWK